MFTYLYKWYYNFKKFKGEKIIMIWISLWISFNVYLIILFPEKVLKELKEAEKRQKQLEKKDKKVCLLKLFLCKFN